MKRNLAQDYFYPHAKINGQDSILAATVLIWRHLCSQLSLFALLKIKIKSYYNWTLSIIRREPLCPAFTLTANFTYKERQIKNSFQSI